MRRYRACSKALTGQLVQGEETVEEAEERLCVICLVNNRDTTVLPCRHMCMCHECAQVRLLLPCLAKSPTQ